jgi:hypothetical protein
VPGITAMLLATAWGGSTYAWNSAEVIALYIASGALIIAFVLIEMYLMHQRGLYIFIIFQFIFYQYRYVAKEPLLSMKLFTIRNFVLSSIISFMIGKY